MNENREIRVRLDDSDFVWDGERWYDACTFTTPPRCVVTELDSRARDQMAAIDDAIGNPIVLVQKATRAKNAGQYERALRLCRRALGIDSRNEHAAAVLSSTLRCLGRANDALAVARMFPHTTSVPLLTTRAAAHCDLGQWPEALQTVRRALGCSDGQCEPTFNVLERIRANAPQRL